jgi:hypothetical protein
MNPCDTPGVVLTDICVLHIFPISLFRFDDFVGALNKVLDEHLRGNGDDKSSIVGAVCNVFISMYDLFDTGN